MEKVQAKRKIYFRLRHQGAPREKDVSAIIREIPSGSPVLIFRTKIKRWEVPDVFFFIDGKSPLF